jgi:SHS2 domain-containing protein
MITGSLFDVLMANAPGSRWEHFEHMADIGVRGFGPSPAEAFAHAAVALSAVICDPATIHTVDKVEFECQASELELLFVDWLNAVIYEMAVRRMLFGRFDVNISGDRLKATAWGEPLDRQRHQPAVEIKGATFTELKVSRESDGQWLAQCVVDV